MRRDQLARPYLTCSPLRERMFFVLVSLLAVFSINDEIGAQTAEFDPRLPGRISGSLLRSKPEILWSYESEPNRGQRDNGLSAPFVSDGFLYVGDDEGDLLAFNAVTGDMVWTHPHGERIYSRPISDGKNVYVTSTLGVDAVACEDGSVVWEKRSKDGKPMGVGNCTVWPGKMPGEGKISTLFYSTDDGTMHAIDTRSGRSKWRKTLMENAPEDPPGFDGNSARMAGKASRPTGVSTNGNVVIQSIFDQCRIVAVGNRSGAERWSFPTEGWTLRAACIDGDEVFIGSQSDKIFCVSLETGQAIWSFKTGSRIESTPSVDKNHVFVPSCDGKLYCLNRADGKKVWEYSAGRVAIYCQPLVTDDAVFFNSGDGHVHAVDKTTGKQIWKLKVQENGDLYSKIATDGERLFVTTRCQLNNPNGRSTLFALGRND